MAFAMRNHRLVLAWVIVISIVAATQLPYLKISISPQSLTIEDSPAQRFYEDTVATFGVDRITILYISDPKLMSPDKLAAIKPVVAAVEELPFVEKTSSLFSVADIRVEGDLVTTRPFLDQLPDTVQASEQILASALRNPLCARILSRLTEPPWRSTSI